MNQQIAHVCLLVKDYDEAIAFYTQKLNFRLIADEKTGEDLRWVLVAPRGNSNCSLLLQKTDDEQSISQIGNQTDRKVFMILKTDNFERNYQNLINQKIRLGRDRSDEVYGTVCVFADLYGNKWDLMESK